MTTSKTLFLALTVPIAGDLLEAMDADDLADAIAYALNQAWHPGASWKDRVLVNAIPSPQWLTPETLANLRRATGGLP